MQEGRVFVAGDAAHVMPPTGGFGGNCGIHDAWDLAWKLAYVLDGRAHESLLATFDAERQPVGAFTTEQAYTRYVLRLDPSLGKDDLMPIVGEAAVELGFRHRSAAVSDAGGEDEPIWEDPREPSARPGFRAPHAFVTVNGAQRSTLDLFGRGFVVLAGSNGEDWSAEAQGAGDSLAVTVDAYRIGAEVRGVDGTLEALYGTGPDGALLVRPDGMVTWRTTASPGDAAGELPTALTAALGRSR